MQRLKPWHWGIIMLAIAGVIVGIGFIPVERTETLDYTTWDDSAWILWDPPSPYNEIWLAEYEVMTWGEFLSLIPNDPYRQGSLLAWAPPQIEFGREITIKNTSSRAGYFTVRFGYRGPGGGLLYDELQQYLNPGQHAQFLITCDKSLGTAFTWEDLEIIAPKAKETERLFW